MRIRHKEKVIGQVLNCLVGDSRGDLEQSQNLIMLDQAIENNVLIDLFSLAISA
ncbi:hypothetical protein [Saccharospirillum impatiens]|uniref:hypothetical protein n=1 Tax=Saccharospirillum impatiens TaxID=169438 RepID=UPI0012F95EDA|nr:hypothetical protein [Saccharospirillum impatiens]